MPKDLIRSIQKLHSRIGCHIGAHLLAVEMLKTQPDNETALKAHRLSELALQSDAEKLSTLATAFRERSH